MYLYFWGVVVYLEILQLLNILRYNQTISALSAAVRRGCGAVASMSGVTLMVMFGYAVLGQGLFGSYLYEYSSVAECILTLTSALLGGFEFEMVTEALGYLGRVYLLLYLLTVMLMLVNFYISIINDYLSDTMGDPESLPKDYEVVDYILESLTSLLAGKKTKNDDIEDENTTRESNALSTEDPIHQVQILLENISIEFADYQSSAIFRDESESEIQKLS